MLIGALLMGAFFFFRRRKEDVGAPRGYGMVDAYGRFGLGGSGPGQNVPYSAAGEEATPFVIPGGQGTPYMDAPYQRGSSISNYSNVRSEGTLPSAMQRGSTYSVSDIPQSAVPQGAMFYATQQNMGSTMGSSLGSVSASSTYRPYTTEPMVPSSPSEYITPSIAAGPLTGAAYAVGTSGSGSGSGPGSAAYPVGASSRSGTGSAAYPVSASASRSGSGFEGRMAEAGPSRPAVFTIANPSPSSPVELNEKQGPIPPQRQESVIIQHEDVSDVVELPPAYKERSDH